MTRTAGDAGAPQARHAADAGAEAPGEARSASREPGTVGEPGADGEPGSASEPAVASEPGAATPAGFPARGHRAANPVDVTLERLEDQIGWYDKRAASSQRRFKVVKFLELLAAALVPIIAMLGFGWTTWTTAALGGLIVILQGFEQLNQDQQNWITYRSTCEQLKHEKYLFHAGAGPYATARQPARRLADRIEALISQEHSKWVENREEAAEQLQNVEASS